MSYDDRMTQVSPSSRTGWLSRRRALLLGAGAAAAAPPVPRLQPVAAAARFDIAQGNVEPIPIALPDFIAGAIDRETARDITQIIVANLQRSGVFARIDPATYIERIISFDAFPRFPDWRQIKAQFLVTGRVSREGNSLKAEFRLWDVFAGSSLDGRQYTSSPENWRRIANIISDAIYETVTGDRGHFDSEDSR